MIARICCCALLLGTFCFAVENDQVRYAGGTAGPKVGTLGRLDLSSESLIFEAVSMRVVIPYKSIDSFAYSREAKRHLGVLPAIAVGLVKQRQHSHFFHISFRDEHDTRQVVIFEVSKHAVRNLQTVLSDKARQTCASRNPCIQPK